MKIFVRAYLLCTICMMMIGISTAQVRWERTGFSAAVEKSIKQEKILMVDFYTDWCIPCKELDKIVFTDDSVIVRFINDTYVSTKVNAEKGEGRLLAKKYSVRGYPTLLFIDKGQLVRGRIVGLRGRDQYFEAIKTAGGSEEKGRNLPPGK